MRELLIICVSMYQQEAFRCIETQLGEPLERLYSKISPQPIAAASLGQVYKAVLPTGEEVAVKVQRPGTGPKKKRVRVGIAGGVVVDGVDGMV